MKDQEKLFYQWVGNRIAMIRKKRKLTQKELADLLELSRASIVNIEKGRQTPPLYTFWNIADKLKIDVDKILPFKGEHKLPNVDIIIENVEGRSDIDDKDKAILSEILKKDKTP